MLPAALAAILLAGPVVAHPGPQPPPRFRGPETPAEPLSTKVLREGPRVLQDAPDSWCPAGPDFLRWLDGRSRLVPPRFPGNAKAMGATGGPNVFVRNGIVVMEDDGTLLRNDRQVDLENLTLVLTPSGGAWDVDKRPLVYEPAVGGQLFAGAQAFTKQAVDLGSFAFPFGGSPRTRLWVTSNMEVSFVDPAGPGGAQVHLADELNDRTPHLGPLHSGTSLYGWDAFVSERPDRVVITWRANDGGGIDVDVQAVLLADGSIRFNYKATRGVLNGSAVVVDGDPTFWSTRALAGSAADPPDDVPLPPPDGPAIDVLEVRGFQVSDSDLLQVELELAQPLPPVTTQPIEYAFELRDEPGGDVFSTLFYEWTNGAWTYASTPIEANGNVLRVTLNRADMAVADDDIEVTAWTAEAWNWLEAVTVNLTWTTFPSAHLMQDFTTAPLRGLRGPVVESFTIPELLPYSVYDVFRQRFEDPPIDGLAIYQNIYTDIIFFAGAYSTVGNAHADGIGVGNSTDPFAPALLHMNTIRYGWNSWDEGKGLVLNHEFGHHWLYFISIMENGSPTKILGETAHPAGWVHIPAAAPFFAANDASCMGGSTWTDNLDGTFTSPPNFVNHGYSWHELYLMGLADPGEVTDWWYLKDSNPGLPDAYWPPASATVTATRVGVTFDQLLQAMGPRNPDRAGSPTNFRVPMVLVVRPGQFSQGDIDEVVHTCDVWEPFFHAATLDRGSIECHRIAERPPRVTIVDPPSDVTVAAGDTLAFVGEGFDPDGDVVDLTWDFGGVASAASGPGPHPVTFPTMGTYVVTLTGRDATGMDAPAPDVRTITVTCRTPLGVEGLRVAHDKFATLTFTWDDLVPLPDEYVIAGSMVPSGGFGEITSGPRPLTVPQPPERLWFYLVAARNLPDCLGPW